MTTRNEEESEKVPSKELQLLRTHKVTSTLEQLRDWIPEDMYDHCDCHKCFRRLMDEVIVHITALDNFIKELSETDNQTTKH